MSSKRQTQAGVETPPGLSRRRLLGVLPAAAAGVALAGVADATPASAGVGDAMILGEGNDGGAATTSITSTNADAILQIISPDVHLQTVMLGGYIGLADFSGDGGGLSYEMTTDAEHTTASVYIEDGAALLTVNGRTTGSESGASGMPAVQANATGAPAIQASTTSGLDGPTEMPSTAIEAVASGHSTGISATSDSGHAIVGANTDPRSDYDAATFTTAGVGRAVFGVSTNPQNTYATVTGVNYGPGPGLWGTQSDPRSTGPAVVGVAAAKGRGAMFSGGAASMRLLPGALPNHPPAGLIGDFYLDRTSRLWFCKGGASWHQVA
jgi:hypothetical protein